MEELLVKSYEELSAMIRECEVLVSVQQAKINEIGAAMGEKKRLEDLKNKLSGITLEDIEKIKAQILSAAPVVSEESVRLN
jgi:hypothetical protein